MRDEHVAEAESDGTHLFVFKTKLRPGYLEDGFA